MIGGEPNEFLDKASEGIGMANSEYYRLLKEKKKMKAIIVILLRVIAIAAIIFLPLIMLAGCNSESIINLATPDEFIINRIEFMGEDAHFYGMSWHIPQPFERKK